MGRRLKNINLFVRTDAEDAENSPENSGVSPRAAVSKVASPSSFKRSKRGVHKRVVSVPIKDVERLTGPPPDSWAWRKYGQKPIKGSPYPRGYYRCSSSKGCPARKQVERSKVDPTVVTVTYSCDHNHPLPASKSNRHRTPVERNISSSVLEEELEDEEEDEEEEEEEMEVEKNHLSNSITSKSDGDDQNSDGKLTDFTGGALIGEYGWFSDFETSSSCAVLETPIPTQDDRIAADDEMAMVFTMGEEDESLFADLGELPECSAVFRRVTVAEQRRRSLATTG